MEKQFINALSILSEHNPQANTSHIDYSYNPPKLLWPGNIDEEICLRILNQNCSQEFKERMTRADYFSFSYCYQGNVQIRYHMSNEKVIRTARIKKNDIYAGQPYLLCDLMSIDEDAIIISVFVQENTFFNYFMPHIIKYPALFQFFMGASQGKKSEKLVIISENTNELLRNIIQEITVKYVSADPNKQEVLKSMTLSFLLEFDYQRSLSDNDQIHPSKVDDILHYMIHHLDSVTVTDIANHFGYHPNYVSTFLRKLTGKTFTEIILEQRMTRAKLLLEETNLTIDEISRMVGYDNTSNFYKHFKKHYGSSPRIFTQNYRQKFL